jgi:hypothetical protein
MEQTMTDLTMGANGLELKKLHHARRVLADRLHDPMGGGCSGMAAALEFEKFVEAKFDEMQRRRNQRTLPVDADGFPQEQA